MYIVSIDMLNTKKSIVTFEDGSKWPLYNTEVRKYKLQVECVLEQDEYKVLYKDVVLRRAKLRCLNLLKQQDRTRKQLSDKLYGDKYDDRTVNEAIAYVESYGYIDDYRLAENYYQYHSDTMSHNEIKRKLILKGVPNDIIDKVIPSNRDDEIAALRILIDKKCLKEKISDAKSYAKVANFLMRKGFSYEMIRYEIGESSKWYEENI